VSKNLTSHDVTLLSNDGSNERPGQAPPLARARTYIERAFLEDADMKAQ